MKNRTRYARVIHPFRTSGVNPRPAPQGRPQSPQTPAPHDAAAPPFHLVALGATRLQDPTLRGDASGIAVTLNGSRVYVPGGLSVAFGRSGDGRDIAYLIDADDNLTILVGTERAGVQELADVPEHMCARIRSEMFGR